VGFDVATRMVEDSPMTIWGRHVFLLGSVVVISLSLGTGGCGSSTVAGGGPESPAKSGKGKKSKKAGGDESAASEGDDGAVEEIPDLPLPKAGVQGEENRSMGAKMSFTLEDDTGAAAGLLDKGWSLAEDRRVLVDKVGETAVTQYSILYGERKTSGLQSWSKLPTEGKGYTVARKGGSLSVLDNGKKEATAEEREVVQAEYGFMGKANPLGLAIAKAAEDGEQSLEPPAYRFLLGYIPEITFDSVTIAHSGDTDVGGREAYELDVTVAGKIPDGDIIYTFEINGPAVVDATTAWCTSLALEGPLEISGKIRVKGKQMTAHGKGSLKMERKATIR